MNNLLNYYDNEPETSEVLNRKKRAKIFRGRRRRLCPSVWATTRRRQRRDAGRRAHGITRQHATGSSNIARAASKEVAGCVKVEVVVETA